MSRSYFRLDPALIRPGRVDFKEEVGYCSAVQLERMFARFYPESSAAAQHEFASKALNISESISPAMIQGYFMYHKVRGERAATGLDLIIVPPLLSSEA